MAKIEIKDSEVMTITKRVKVGRRSFPVKKVDAFIADIAGMYVEATAIQMRIMAYNMRDYIIDKLLAYEPETGKKKIRRYPFKSKATGDSRIQPAPPEEAPFEEKYEIDKDRMKKIWFLPARYDKRTPKEKVPFEMEVLSKKYLDKKVSKGHDARILLATGDYVKGIVVKRKEHPKYGVYYSVSMANRKHKTSDLQLKELALVHEFGVEEKTIPLFGNKDVMVKVSTPARPHWRPALRELLKEMKKLGENVSARVLSEALTNLR